MRKLGIEEEKKMVRKTSKINMNKARSKESGDKNMR